jgi:hypothetical protein
MEIKFVIDSVLGERVRAWARTHLDADPHGSGPAGDEYDITSIYFDTPAYDVFERRGSYGRAKYRIRRYGESDRVFLERKLRTSRMLAKRRTEVRVADLGRLPVSGEESDRGRWFARRIAARHLQPVCTLTYHRIARVALTGAGPARLTIDSGIQVCVAEHLRFDCTPAVPVLADQFVLELKCGPFVPAIFKQLVQEFGLVPRTASKYRLGLAALNGIPVRQVSPGVAALAPTAA